MAADGGARSAADALERRAHGIPGAGRAGVESSRLSVCGSHQSCDTRAPSTHRGQSNNALRQHATQPIFLWAADHACHCSGHAALPPQQTPHRRVLCGCGHWMCIRPLRAHAHAPPQAAHTKGTSPACHESRRRSAAPPGPTAPPANTAHAHRSAAAGLWDTATKPARTISGPKARPQTNVCMCLGSSLPSSLST